MCIRDRYHNLRYRPGNNLVTFIELHEAKAQAYEEAGRVIGDYDCVLELHKSLLVEYDDALSFYEQKDPDTRSYNIYRNTLIQRYKRHSVWMNTNSMSDNANKSSTRFHSGTSSNTKMLNSLKVCFNCSVKGHVARDCPKNIENKPEAKPASIEPILKSSIENQNPDQLKSKQNVKDWTQFKKYQSTAQTVTLLSRASKILCEIESSYENEFSTNELAMMLNDIDNA